MEKKNIDMLIGKKRDYTSEEDSRKKRSIRLEISPISSTSDVMLESDNQHNTQTNQLSKFWLLHLKPKALILDEKAITYYPP
jgi:hypothetical protein